MKTYIMTTRKVCGEDMPCAVSTIDGSYIGQEAEAKRLESMGIAPESSYGGEGVSNIGFCAKEQKWYGWSHRAIYGFGVGSTVKKGDCAYKPKDKDDFLSSVHDFWRDRDYHSDSTAYHKERGVQVEWIYNDKVPNEKIRGTISGIFTPYPEQFGKGEWEAESLEDARQMAIDFAEGVA